MVTFNEICFPTTTQFFVIFAIVDFVLTVIVA